MNNDPPATRARQLAASVGLSALFLAVYGACNWVTAHRTGVGTIAFEWERQIPFVPFMIVPYMSIDLLFVGAPFLCATRRELAAFSKRVAFGTVVAGLCFLLFPLRFAFERPSVSGWLGLVFNGFRMLDLPYNLAPSLHITFCTILAETYARHTRGSWRRLSLGWFALIACSAVLTYQHHILDVLSGFYLGACSCYLFDDSEISPPAKPNWRIGRLYLAATAFFLVLLVSFQSWALILLWPCLCLAIVASAYLGLGASVFRKRNGVVTWSSRMLLAPYFIGQYLSLWYYRRRCRRWDKITDNLWIGGVLTRAEAQRSVARGVTAVLDLTAEFSETPSLRALSYLNIPVLDLTAPTTNELRAMTEFISSQASRGIVYVHCKIGYSRSAAAVAAYLVAARHARDVSDALKMIRHARPSIVVREEASAALEAFVLTHQATLEVCAGSFRQVASGFLSPQ